jgi:hypothetical protein
LAPRFTLTLLLLASGARAAAQDGGTLWATTLLEPGQDQELLAAAAPRSGSAVWLVTGSRSRAERNGLRTVSLVEVDGHGRTRSRTGLNSILGDSPLGAADFAAATGREVFLCVPSADRTLRLLAFNAVTRRLTVKAGLPLELADTHRLLAHGDNTLLLIAGRNAAKLSASGRVLWIRNAGGDRDVFLDGVEERGGGLALVGAAVNGSQQVERLLVEELDAAGRPVRKSELEGRYARIAQGGQGAFAVSEHRSDAPESDLWAQGLNTALAARWDRLLARDALPFSSRIEPAGRAGYLVAAVRRGGSAWLWRIGEDGAEIWARPAQPPQSESRFLPGIRLLRAGADFVLAGTVLVTSADGRSQIQGIRLIRIAGTR